MVANSRSCHLLPASSSASIAATSSIRSRFCASIPSSFCSDTLLISCLIPSLPPRIAVPHKPVHHPRFALTRLGGQHRGVDSYPAAGQVEPVRVPTTPEGRVLAEEAV